jgi:subtilisin family serine protease
MNIQTKYLPWLAALCLGAASGVSAQPVAGTQPSQAIAGQYIVVFRDRVADPPGLGRQLTAQVGGQFMHGYSHTIKGFSLRLPQRGAASALEALRRNPNVAYIEADASVSVNEAAIEPPAAQNSAPWGLDRIDQVDRPLSSQYLYRYRGAGVYAFVLDTGIMATHEDFGGRVHEGTTFINDGAGSSDCHGHGTHVAGTIGGAQWGVAKGVALVPVRVLDCAGSGTWSGVIAGIDWVAGQTNLRRAVANLSLGGAWSASVNGAVAAAVDQGVTVVVAAGNANANACNYSPASEPKAITVGATTSADARASFSNHGACLDLFAPGAGITSAWHTSAWATANLSGTSMAAPHVAGVAALVLAASPQATPTMVTRFLTDHASVNKLTSIGAESPNRLLYSLAVNPPQEPVTLTVSVATIQGAGEWLNRKQWLARADVAIRDMQGMPVANATVSGSFAPGGSTSCITNHQGLCRLVSQALPSSRRFTDFSVTQVAGTHLHYDANQNTATRIRINRP